MITHTLMYWLTRADSIHDVFFGLGFFYVVITIFAIFGIIGCREVYDVKCVKKCVFVGFASAILFIVNLLISAFVPTTKEMAAIIIIPAVANNHEVQGIGKDMASLAKEWLKEMKPENVKGNVKAVSDGVKDVIKEIKK